MISIVTCSYARNARRLAQLQQRKPVSALEEALSWVELLAEFQDLSMLRSRAGEVPLFVYKQLDVLTILAVIDAVIIAVLYWCCRTCCCRARSTAAKSANKRKPKRE